jgi:antitoxin (DNA-binding transcriptional repressor) of toxin-antitoxin stability system
MKRIDISEFRNRIDEYTRRMEAGEAFVVGRNASSTEAILARQREVGLDFEALRRWKEKNGYDQIVRPIPDDFDDPLPWDFLFTQSL